MADVKKEVRGRIERALRKITYEIVKNVRQTRIEYASKLAKDME